MRVVRLGATCTGAGSAGAVEEAGDMGIDCGLMGGRSSASASVSLSRRIGREKSTRPLRSTDQTGMVPVG